MNISSIPFIVVATANIILGLTTGLLFLALKEEKAKGIIFDFLAIVLFVNFIVASAYMTYASWGIRNVSGAHHIHTILLWCSIIIYTSAALMIISGIILLFTTKGKNASLFASLGGLWIPILFFVVTVLMTILIVSVTIYALVAIQKVPGYNTSSELKLAVTSLYEGLAIMISFIIGIGGSIITFLIVRMLSKREEKKTDGLEPLGSQEEEMINLPPPIPAKPEGFSGMYQDDL